MRKFSVGQRKVASEILGNIAVAWFTAGVISPFFTKPQELFDFLFAFVVSLVMVGLFSKIALDLVRDINK